MRLDTLSKSTCTVYLMARDLKASLFDVLFKYKYFETLKLPIFLGFTLLFSILVFVFRSNPLSAYAAIPISILLIWASFDSKVFFSSSLWEMLKLIPLIMIIAGCLINLFFFYYIRNRRKKNTASLPPGGRRFQ